MSSIQELGQYISAIVRDATFSSRQLSEIAKTLQTYIDEAQRLIHGTESNDYQRIINQLTVARKQVVSAQALVEQAATKGNEWVRQHVGGSSDGLAGGGGLSDGGEAAGAGSAAMSGSFGSVLDSANDVIAKIAECFSGPAKNADYDYDSSLDPYATIKDSLQSRGVEHRPLQPVNGERTQTQIIARLGGGDKTDGSCSSLAFAYAGNLAGYDVLDFRDGGSRDFFSLNASIERIANLPGINSVIIRGTDDFDCSHRLFELMVEGKEYYFATAEHAAVIRKTGGYYEYLELQSQDRNGWNPLDDYSLTTRFGCVDENAYDLPNFLIDIESLANSNLFIDILGFINTAETEQHKGVGGSVK